MTPLLNGQAMNVGFASTSVTVMRGSMRLMKRAQVAPAKPPPMTAAREPVPGGIAGSGSRAAVAPAAAVLRNSRRFFAVMIGLPSSILLRAVPGGDGFDLVVRETLGEEMHHGRRRLPRLERLHGGDDVRRVAADEPRHRGLDRSRRGMAAGTRQRAGRGIGRTRRRGRGDCQQQSGNRDKGGARHVRNPPMNSPPDVSRSRLRAGGPFVTKWHQAPRCSRRQQSAAPALSYGFLRSWLLSGSERTCLPFAEKNALHNAGAT